LGVIPSYEIPTFQNKHTAQIKVQKQYNQTYTKIAKHAHTQVDYQGCTQQASHKHRAQSDNWDLSCPKY